MIGLHLLAFALFLHAGCGASSVIESPPGTGGSSPSGDGGSSATGAGGSRSMGFGPCEDPVSIDNGLGQPTGFVRCADGAVNRASAGSCEAPPRPCQGTENVLECRTDADCGEPGLTCVTVGSTEQTSCVCSFANGSCKTDADCPADRYCWCGSLAYPGGEANNRCVPIGSCRTNDDCASGQCGIDVGSNCDETLACRTHADTCHAPADCPNSNGCDVSHGVFACRHEDDCVGF